jgi:hypothetical protein
VPLGKYWLNWKAGQYACTATTWTTALTTSM